MSCMTREQLEQFAKDGLIEIILRQRGPVPANAGLPISPGDQWRRTSSDRRRTVPL